VCDKLSSLLALAECLPIKPKIKEAAEAITATVSVTSDFIQIVFFINLHTSGYTGIGPPSPSIKMFLRDRDFHLPHVVNTERHARQ
jgi:hypothetical protein